MQIRNTSCDLFLLYTWRCHHYCTEKESRPAPAPARTRARPVQPGGGTRPPASHTPLISSFRYVILTGPTVLLVGGQDFSCLGTKLVHFKMHAFLPRQNCSLKFFPPGNSGRFVRFDVTIIPLCMLLGSNPRVSSKILCFLKPYQP
jgi:hypothetical protein